MDSDKLLNLATDRWAACWRRAARRSPGWRSPSTGCCRPTKARTAQVFAIPSCLIVSLMAEDGRPVTRMRRIRAHGTDLELLETLQRPVPAASAVPYPPLDEARAMVDRSLPPAAATVPPRCCWATVWPPPSSVPCSAAGFGTA